MAKLNECIGRKETIDVDGQNIVHTFPPTRFIKTHMRREVLARDGRCVIDGCHSNYRLEAHHIIERSKSGPDTPNNLVTLYWWHHHIAVHRYGQRIDPDTPPTRRRLLPSDDRRRHRQPHSLEHQPPDPYQQFLDKYGPPRHKPNSTTLPHPGG